MIFDVVAIICCDKFPGDACLLPRPRYCMAQNKGTAPWQSSIVVEILTEKEAFLTNNNNNTVQQIII